MNMGFSVSNLMIVAMTVVVVFGDDEEPVTSEEIVPVLNWKRLAVYEGCEEPLDFIECQDQLEADGFSKHSTGFRNLVEQVPNVNWFEDLKHKQIDLKEYKKYATKEINKRYLTFSPQNSFTTAYYFGLALHVLTPSRMLPVKTWCDIHEKGTYYAKEFMKIDTNPYRKYLQRIARNTGLSTKYQTTVYRTIDVCYGEVSNHLLGVKSENGKTRFPSMYNDVTRITDPHPLNWCSINACFETLTNAGFLDASAKDNIRKVMRPTFKIEQTSGYIFDFYQYLKDVSTGLTDNYEIVNPHDSRIGIKSGYLRNWCGVQVCHADLMDAGYIYEHATDNYRYVYPTIKHLINVPNNRFFATRYHLVLNDSSRILSEFVRNFSEYLDFIVNVTFVNDSFNSSDPKHYFIPANRMSRSPLDWCKFTVSYPHETIFM